MGAAPLVAVGGLEGVPSASVSFAMGLRATALIERPGRRRLWGTLLRWHLGVFRDGLINIAGARQLDRCP